MSDGRNDSTNYNDDFEGELMTIKGPHHWQDNDPQEQTIRPFKKPIKPMELSKGHHRTKSSSRSTVSAGGSGRKSPSKSHFNKFELPSRPDVVYREQSVEDYSDLFVENDSVFNHRVNQVAKKVRQATPVFLE